jgi:hypothetical protein
MAITKKDGNAHHGYVAPVAWIIVLMCGYWLIADWNSLPGLISAALATIH